MNPSPGRPVTDVEGETTNPSLLFSSRSENHSTHSMAAPGPFRGMCHRNIGRVKMADCTHWKSSAFFLGFSRLSLIPYIIFRAFYLFFRS